MSLSPHLHTHNTTQSSFDVIRFTAKPKFSFLMLFSLSFCSHFFDALARAVTASHRRRHCCACVCCAWMPSLLVHVFLFPFFYILFFWLYTVFVVVVVVVVTAFALIRVFPRFLSPPVCSS
ncbi:hypothetical protein ABB37_05335 [Leptomonas pyrrhocoris]|uniref:Transmembrane protein n=1 Tax=Leptomonas pyrrhocoris TaxID=157538 RepID=A0A0N0DUW2_LEPPY|nr:hypothetical protein ABB37_05335 [Leptomonas pyrrhocoris]KPA79511.1 hypothetical protein ABB37_05335 [Leptomonas pyrrhocoris]|eukprot:XP_015657950.1 hypothetical protein ABB37_05335 [Leptomonas pyrrhocoris]